MELLLEAKADPELKTKVIRNMHMHSEHLAQAGSELVLVTLCLPHPGFLFTT